MEASETEYTISWTPIHGEGSICLGTSGGDQTIMIDKNLNLWADYDWTQYYY